MIQVSIKKQDEITNQGLFSSMEEAEAWLSKHEAKKTFGQPKQVVQQEIEVSPAVLDEQGVEISPAQIQIQEVQIPASYAVVIEDLSAKLAQEKINQEALELLASTDWLIIRELDVGIPCPQDIKTKRQQARDQIIK